MSHSIDVTGGQSPCCTPELRIGEHWPTRCRALYDTAVLGG